MTANQFVEWRFSMGLDRSGAAKALGCSRTTIAAYENGKVKIPLYFALACAALKAGLKPLG